MAVKWWSRSWSTRWGNYMLWTMEASSSFDILANSDMKAVGSYGPKYPARVVLTVHWHVKPRTENHKACVGKLVTILIVQVRAINNSLMPCTKRWNVGRHLTSVIRNAGQASS